MAKFQNVFKEASRRMKISKLVALFHQVLSMFSKILSMKYRQRIEEKTIQVLIQRMHTIKPMDQI